MGYELISGELCLDFINTLDNRPRLELALELLQAYDDLVRWAHEAGAIPAGLATGLRSVARAQPARASAVLRQAVALRECLYRIFTCIAEGKRPAPSDLTVLDRARAETATHLELKSAGRGYSLAWRDHPVRLDAPLWRVAHSAAGLLTSPDLAHVRECEDETCRWFFVDRSRNHRRRWCEMRVCGNRMKAKRFYRLHRARASA